MAFFAMNCFSRPRVQPLGGETYMMVNAQLQRSLFRKSLDGMSAHRELGDTELEGDGFIVEKREKERRAKREAQAVKDESSLEGRAAWEEGFGPGGLAALNLSDGALSLDDGVALEDEAFSFSVWLELPHKSKREAALAPCALRGEAFADCDTDEDEDDATALDDDDAPPASALSMSGEGELGVRGENSFVGSGFFVDALAVGWYHVAAVSANATTRFWANGRLVGEAATRLDSRHRLRPTAVVAIYNSTFGV